VFPFFFSRPRLGFPYSTPFARGLEKLAGKKIRWAPGGGHPFFTAPQVISFFSLFDCLLFLWTPPTPFVRGPWWRFFFFGTHPEKTRKKVSKFGVFFPPCVFFSLSCLLACLLSPAELSFFFLLEPFLSNALLASLPPPCLGNPRSGGHVALPSPLRLVWLQRFTPTVGPEGTFFWSGLSPFPSRIPRPVTQNTQNFIVWVCFPVVLVSCYVVFLSWMLHEFSPQGAARVVLPYSSCLPQQICCAPVPFCLVFPNYAVSFGCFRPLVCGTFDPPPLYFKRFPPPIRRLAHFLLPPHPLFPPKRGVLPPQTCLPLRILFWTNQTILSTFFSFLFSSGFLVPYIFSLLLPLSFFFCGVFRHPACFPRTVKGILMFAPQPISFSFFFVGLGAFSFPPALKLAFFLVYIPFFLVPSVLGGLFPIFFFPLPTVF